MRSVDPDLAAAAEIKAEEGDPHELALEHEGRSREDRQQRQDVEQGLVFRGHDDAARREPLGTAHFDPGAADMLQQPER